MGSKHFWQVVLVTIASIVSLSSISSLDERSLFSAIRWDTIDGNGVDAGAVLVGGTVNKTSDDQNRNSTELAPLSSQVAKSSLEEKRVFEHGHNGTSPLLKPASLLVPSQGTVILDAHVASQQEGKSNESHHVDVKNSTLRAIGNGTVLLVVEDRNTLPKCFASSLDEALEKCLVNGTTAFLCEVEPCAEDNMECGSTCTPDKATVVVRNSFVLDERGVAFDPFDGIIYDISAGCCIFRRWKYRNVVKIPSSVVAGNQSGPLLLLRQSHDQTYYHFAIELMSRLMSTPKFIRTPVGLGEFEINAPTAKSFHKPHLDILMSPPQKPSSLRYRTDMGTLHSLIFFPPERNMDQARTLQREYIKKFDVKCCPSKPTFVVVKRDKTRVVKNLLPFMAMIQESYPDIDFRIVTESEMDRMNFSDYANLFRHAHGVIGGHGAGLSNMIWLDSPHAAKDKPFNPNITVVQMIRDGMGPNANVYVNMSKVLGYTYVEIPCVQAVGARRHNYAPTEIRDFCEAQQMLHPIFAPLSRYQNTSQNISFCP